MKTFLVLIFSFHLSALAGSNLPPHKIIGDGSLCAVVLEPGYNLWGWYVCRNCGGDTLADPDVDLGQICDNCGAPHENEPYNPPHTELRDGNFVLIVPTKSLHRVMPAKGSASDRAAARKAIEPPKVITPEIAPPKKEPVPVDREPPPPPAAAPFDDAAFNDALSEIAHPRPERGIGLIRNVAIGLVLSIPIHRGYAWCISSYRFEGRLTKQGSSLVIEYKDDKGRKFQATVHTEEGDSMIPVRPEGEKVTLHFTNGRGLVGVERLTGDVLVPGE